MAAPPPMDSSTPTSGLELIHSSLPFSSFAPPGTASGAGALSSAEAGRVSGRPADAARPSRTAASDRPPAVLEAELLVWLARRPWQVQGLLALGTALLGWLSLRWTRMPDQMSVMWMADAWLAGFLLFAPQRRWWSLLATQLLVLIGLSAWMEPSLADSLLRLPSHLLEPVLSVLLLRSGSVYRRVQDGPSHVWRALVRGAFVPALAGSSLLTLLQLLLGVDNALPGWPLEFMASLLGWVSLLPVWLAVLSSTWPQLRRDVLTFDLLAALMMSVGTGMVALLMLPFHFVYLGLPLVLAAVLLRYAAVTVLVLAVSLTAGLLLAFGLVAPPAWTSYWQTVLLYIPLLASLVPPLLLASAVAEARQHHWRLRHSRERLRALYERTPAMMFSTGPDGRIISVSSLWLERLGYAREAVLGRAITDFMDDASRRQAAGPDRDTLLTQGEARDIEYRLVSRDGRQLDMLMSATCERDADGRVVRIHAVLEDITRKRLAEQLALEHERSRVVLESVADAVIATDRAGRVDYMNPVASALTGWTLEQVQGRLYGEAFLRQDPDNGTELPDPVALCLHQRSRPALPHTVILRSRDGGEHPIRESVAPLRAADGRLLGAVLTFQDVSQAHAMAVQLAHQAQHDALTGLPNRLLLRDRLQQCLQMSRRNGNLFALMFMDLDHFKQVNDELGHAVGDELLRQVTQRIVAGLRATDTASRLGGDEFVVLLPQIDSALDAGTAATHLLERVAQPYPLGEHTLTTTFSIGIAVHPHDGDDEDTLMRHADVAMYQAKRQGRNRFCFHADALVATSRY
ncbi:MAG TPA: diguanylate cyclase [Burkholderiaceae bacterium]|nr:diguanylate cyclase [Burkholderiaceae bacterium]